MGGIPLGFPDYELTTAKKQMKSEKFLAEMESVLPWPALLALVEPHSPNASQKSGRPLSIGKHPSDSVVAELVLTDPPGYRRDSDPGPTMRRIACIELISKPFSSVIPTWTVRYLLDLHDLGLQIFKIVKAQLSERVMMRLGSIVDATFLASSRSTKKKERNRDLLIHQFNTGNQ